MVINGQVVRIVAAVLRCSLMGENDLTKGASISIGWIVETQR